MLQTWNREDLTIYLTSDATQYKSPHPYLYFHPEYLSCLAATSAVYFWLIKDSNPEPIAFFACAPENDRHWVSLPKAPFGGVILQNYCTNGELEFFISCVREYIAAAGGLSLTIRTPAACYNPNAKDMLHGVYVSTGFCINRTISNHYIFVNNSPFRTRIHSMEQRRLRKSGKAGLRAQLSTTSDITAIFDFIQCCYAEKSYNISICREELQKLRQAFPEHYPVFTISHGEQVVAVIVGVLARQDILYVFLSAYRHEYRAFSPAVLLMESVYGYCQQRRIAILDLGTSLDQHGFIKKSLVQFKEHLGAVACEKTTYYLDIQDQISRQLPSR